jgi:amino acid permease
MKAIKTNIIITGIICITILEICAIFNGVDGVLLTGVIAVIAAAIGVILPTPKILKGGKC